MSDTFKLKLSFCFLQIFIFALAWSGSGTSPENFAPIFCLALLTYAPIAFLKRPVRACAFQKSVFWCGLALVAICITQYFNPSLRLVVLERFSGFVQLEHFKFLPVGVDAPLDKGNPLGGAFKITAMMLVIFACLQLFKNEKRSIFTLKFFAINALAVGAVGTLQKLDVLDLFYDGYFLTKAKFAAFSSSNSAGAFINLALGACMMLFLRAKSFPLKTLWGAGALLCSVSSFFTFSGGAIIMCVFMWFMFAFNLTASFFTRFTDGLRSLVATSFLFLIIGVVGFFVAITNISFEKGFGADLQDSIEARTVIYKTSKDILYENHLWGVGSECFSYYINPKSVAASKEKVANERPDAFKSAHSYIIEFFGEFGIVGAFIFLWAGVSWFLTMFKRKEKLSKLNAMLALSTLVCFLHMCFDIIFMAQSLMLAMAVFASAALSPISKGTENEA